MSASLRIAVLPGDGIGPEITAATRSVLEALNRKFALGLRFEEHAIGHASLERAGTTAHRGSITGIYTVLVEGDDLNDPVADALRAALDGHIVLSRDLAAANHFPAIDVLGSVSRLAGHLLDPRELRAAGALRECLATYRDARDLVAIGAYVRGSDARIDRALGALEPINGFLRQERGERTPRAETMRRLLTLVPPVTPHGEPTAPGMATGGRG